MAPLVWSILDRILLASVLIGLVVDAVSES
jgi:hypothetical protein